MAEYTIGCDKCDEGDLAHRDDCLLALIADLDSGSSTPIVFDDSEVRALRALRDGGLLPPTTVLPQELRDTGS